MIHQNGTCRQCGFRANAKADEFHSLQDVGWYGSAFFLTIAGFQSTWGKAYKYFPLKWSFMVVSTRSRGHNVALGYC